MNEKPKILYVDDEEYNLILFEETFIQKFDIYTTFSEKEGIDILENNEIDLIISDERMPRMSGIEFLKYCSEKYPKPKRILLTAYSDAKTIKDAINIANIFQYVQKPWKEDDLFMIIEKALEIYFLEKENKKQKEELAYLRKKENTKLHLHLSNEIFIEIDTDGIIILANKKACDILDCKEEDILGKNWFEIFLPERIKKEILSISKKILSGEIDSEEYYENLILTKNGEERLIYWHNTTLKDKNGNITGWLSSGKDITEEKKSQLELIQKNQELVTSDEELRASNEELFATTEALKDSTKGLVRAKERAEKNEERFQKLSDLTIEGIIIHKKGIAIDVNRAMLNITGYKAEEVIGKNIIKLLIPKKNHKFITEKFKEKYVDPHETSLMRKDGKLISIESEAFDVFEYDEEIRVTAFRDISKRKENEKEIKKLSTAVEQSYNTIVITDIEGNIEYTNPQFTLITGYAAEEALGKNPRILNAGTQEKEYYNKMWQKISSGEVWMGKFHNKTKNGNLFWERVIITPLKNNDGEIISYMAIKEDITESIENKKQIINVIIEAEERERNHFSKELHDGLGPVLSTLKMYFEWMSKTEDKEKKELIITNGILNIDEAISIVDEISNKLTPRTLNAFGFPAALETFIGRLKVADAKIHFSSNFDKRLETNHEAAIYRVLTELINNTLKHAKAKNIHISIKYKPNEKNLNIEYFDDGIGFNYKEKLETGDGFGLINMQQRIKTFGGSIKFITKMGKGLKVFITFDKTKTINL